MEEKLEGAEAVLLPEMFAKYSALKKLRVKKEYRPTELDEKIRFGRTKVEARLLGKAKGAGVPTPYVFAVGQDYILIEKLDGKTLNKIEGKINFLIWKKAGEFLAKLHKAGIIHGDFTPANLMLDKKGNLSVIDFGLGYASEDAEDKAVDLLTMKNSLDEKNGKLFLSGYLKCGEKKILKHMEEVQKRARYQMRERI